MDWMTREIVCNFREIESTWGTDGPVTVDYRRLGEVMEEHTPKVLATESHLPPIPGVCSRDPRVASSYILAGDIWNFHFKTPGQPPYRVANPENTEKPFEGFMAFWHKLYGHFGETIITADMLRPYVKSVEAMTDFFRGLTDMPLPELRQQCGLDFVEGLEKHFGGNPLNILSEAASLPPLRAVGNGRGLIELLVETFPVAYGQDKRFLYGRRYFFYKKARLSAMLLHAWRDPSDRTRYNVLLDDIDELGAPIDYQIPRILHAPHMRVLLYSPALDQAIESGEEVVRGTAEEVFIRSGAMAALAYWAVRKKVPFRLLDSYLFSISRGLPNKAHDTEGSDY